LELAELVAVTVSGQDGELRSRGAKRQLLAEERHARGQDRVLELVLPLGELGRDEPALAGFAEPVQPFLLVAVGLLLLVAEGTELLPAEEVRVAGDDRRLLRDFLLADADRASFLGTFEQVALKLPLELRGAPDRSYGHRRTLASHAGRPRGERAHRSRQLLERKGLEQHGVRLPSLEHRMVGTARQHGDGKPRMVTLDFREQLCSVTRTDVNVEQDDVDVASSKLDACLVQGCCLANRAALELEVHTAEQANRGVVVDDENGLTGRFHRAASLLRNRIRSYTVYRLKMRYERTRPDPRAEREPTRTATDLPTPSPEFRRRAWVAFQRALDPFGHVKPLRPQRR